MAGTGHRAAQPFVGRDVLIDDLLTRVRSGSHLMLAGRSGIGKTRVAAQLVDTLATAGRRTERVMASVATSGFQCGALAPLGRPVGVEPGDVHALLNFYLQRWRGPARDDGPVLLWVDDVHQLDDLSALVCRHAVDAGLVQLIVTRRLPGQVPADIEAMTIEGAVELVEVPSLSLEATGRLATAWSDRDLNPAELEQIHQLSDGFPLFVRDLARNLDAARPLEEVHRLGGLDVWLSQLSPELRRVAELIAVAEPIPARLLVRHRRALIELIEAGVARRHGDDDIRLEHPLYSTWLIEALGPLVEATFAELVAITEGLAVDPTVAADWHLRAGQALPEDLATTAVRAALQQADPDTAARFVPHLGDGAELLAAQTSIQSGDLEAGLGVLDQVRLGSTDPGMRIEAASMLARHVGLTKGDTAAARVILDEADDVALPPQLRAPLLLGRLWLTIYGGAVVDDDLELVRALTEPPIEANQLMHDLLVAGTGVAQALDSSRTATLIDRMLEVESAADIDTQSVTRSRSIESWHHLLGGDAGRGSDLMVERFDDVSSRQDLEGSALMGSAGGYITALAGRIGESLRLAEGGLAAADPIDWYGNGQLAAMVLSGNRCLAGTHTEPQDAPAVAGSDLPGDLAALLSARATSLAAEFTGRDRPGSTVLGPLRQLIDDGKFMWVCMGAIELVDARSVDDIHQLLSDACGPFTSMSPVMEAVVLSADARLARDAEGLVAAATTFESSGFTIATARAFGDVLRLVDGESQHVSTAARGLSRCLLSWDGDRVWCGGDHPDVPTVRQLDVARRASIDRSAAEIADDLVLSKRTVENHLYRTMRVLGVDQRADLADALAPRGLPANGDGTGMS